MRAEHRKTERVLRAEDAEGTGGHAEYLTARGHQVIGVDSSAEMLTRARARVSKADFRHGDLRRLPLPDDHVDVVPLNGDEVCPTATFAEAAV